MKKYIKYFLVLIFFSLIIKVNITNENDVYWMVVLIFVLWTTIPSIALIQGINPNTSVLQPNSRLRKKEKQRWLSIADPILRIVFILVGLLCFWFYSLPIYQDTYSLIVHNQIERGQYTVSYFDTGVKDYLIAQWVRFKHSDKDNYTYYFSLKNRLRKNNTYNVTIFPRSKIIISAQLVESK